MVETILKEELLMQSVCVSEEFVPHSDRGQRKIRNVTANELCEQSVQEADQMSVLHV
jgi:hypothetical protein